MYLHFQLTEERYILYLSKGKSNYKKCNKILLTMSRNWNYLLWIQWKIVSIEKMLSDCLSSRPEKSLTYILALKARDKSEFTLKVGLTTDFFFASRIHVIYIYTETSKYPKKQKHNYLRSVTRSRVGWPSSRLSTLTRDLGKIVSLEYAFAIRFSCYEIWYA